MWVHAQTPSEIDAAFDALETRRIERWSHNIRISGTITDQDGKPLDNVRCIYSTFKAGGFEGNTNETTKYYNGTYEITQDGIASIDLRFAKNGYYGMSFDYDLVTLDRVTSETERGFDITRNIVLTRVPEGLKPHYGTVGLGVRREANACITVARFDDYINMVEYPSSHASIDIPWSSFDYPYITSGCLELTTCCLALDVRRSSGPVELLGTGIDATVNGQMVLTLLNGDTTDGLKLVPSVVSPYRNKGIFPTEMTVAPEDGYEPELTVPSSLLYKDDHEALYFWIKCKGFYGKGCLTALRADVVSGHLEIEGIAHLFFGRTPGGRNLFTAPSM